MYRHSASFPGNHIGPTTKPSSSNRVSDDSDSDMSLLLEQKRQQLDEEIVQFKALKDKEFQDFENSLRKQRRKRKREAKAQKESSRPNEPEARPGALSLLGGVNKNGNQLNGGTEPARKTFDKSEDGRSARHPSSSQPTTSLDRQNIKGETTPPRAGSPLPTEHLSKQISRSPPNPNLAHTPPKGWSRKAPTPSTPIKENHDSFTGVFTPAYLPLLESKATKDPLHHQTADPKLQRHNSFSHSQTSSSILSPTSQSQRSQTAPVLPSTSLPSALRTASGSAVRRRKHVTFKLADSVVVDPSSSYEEGPSPEPREEGGDEMHGMNSDRRNGKPHAEESTSNEAEAGLPPPSWKRQIRSPTIKGRERRPSPISADPNLSPRANLDQADDGGSGVGFFELDEEIASPGFGAVRPFEMDEADDLQEDETAKGRWKQGDYFEDEKGQTYEYGGSVPIDIRPTGSWVGTFGH